MTGLPRVANFTGAAAAAAGEAALIVIKVRIGEMLFFGNALLVKLLVKHLYHHLADPRRDVSTDWLLWEASSPLMNTFAGRENLEEGGS